MKVNVSVEATAQEMREFLGLPNIQPLHDDVVQTFRDNVQRGVISFDSFNQLFKPLLPAQMRSMEMVQKFWEAFAKAGTGSKDTTGGATDNAADANSDKSQNSTKKTS